MLLPAEIKVFPDLEEMSRQAASRFVRLANQRVAENRRFTVALSGGSTPRRLYEILGTAPTAQRIPWANTHLFQVDERCVPPDHVESNYRMIHASLLSHGAIRESNFHRMAGELADHDEAARQYAEEIRRVLRPKSTDWPRLDLVFLGMGPDGHTASLFPGSDALDVQVLWVAPNYVEKFKMYRLTLTLPVLNAAASITFLVGGADKAETVRQVLDASSGPDRFPVQRVRPTNGQVSWYLDDAAAALLRVARPGLSSSDALSTCRCRQDHISTLSRAWFRDLRGSMAPAMHHRVKIAPSILSADFTRLGEQVKAVEAAGVDRVQIDVMDGRFVPNITFGTPAVEALRPLTKLILEVHLMVTPPEEFIEKFARAGADTLIVHQEATPHLHRAIQQIHSLGRKAGVALNPSTPAAVLSEVLESLQLVLVMTVNPGFGGQEFIPAMLKKVSQVRKEIEGGGFDCELEVDGGIHEKTAAQVVEAGADVLVAGSSVYDANDGVAAAIARLRTTATGG